MIAPERLSVVELDHGASTAEAPYGVITADCSSPREIDDGIFVEPLPAAQETYRVGVCVADTSKIYKDRVAFTQAMANTEAKYWQIPGGELGYDPMIETEFVKSLEFSQGNIRDALIVSFVVSKRTAPSDISVSFGKVEVTSNLSYKDFWGRCRPEEVDERFGRASAFIIRHLQYTSGGDNDVRPAVSLDAIYHELMNSSSASLWLRGARINESFMVAANHLVGRIMAEEERPAIYRIHDPADGAYSEFLPPNVARYSGSPGKHAGLNLEPYCRVTSPLRRLEDFMMSYQLKQRFLGRATLQRDVRDIKVAVLQLNRRVIQGVSLATMRASTRTSSSNGYNTTSQPFDEEGQIIALHPTARDEALA